MLSRVTRHALSLILTTTTVIFTVSPLLFFSTLRHHFVVVAGVNDFTFIIIYSAFLYHHDPHGPHKFFLRCRPPAAAKSLHIPIPRRRSESHQRHTPHPSIHYA